METNLICPTVIFKKKCIPVWRELSTNTNIPANIIPSQFYSKAQFYQFSITQPATYYNSEMPI